MIATSPVPGTIPSLDGIRAIAVGLVFFAHGGLEKIVPGGLGVTLFFVLSGFLITTLMRHEHAATGSLSLRAFYLRRVLRLMPPLCIVVAAAALLSSLSVIEGGFSPAGLLSVLFYVGNYFCIATDFHGLPAGIGVTWSLAVEEHFYLLFPLLALVILRWRRTQAVTLLLGLCAAILLWRCWLALHGAPEPYVGMASDTRADAILIGCALALWRNPVIDARSTAHPRRDLAIGGGCIALLVATLAWRNDLFRLTARYTLQSLAIAPLIYLAVVHAARAPLRWLNTRPMVYLGTISYTIYLSHQVILNGLAWNFPQLGGLPTLVLGALLTLAVAEPMRRWIEAPCARLRRRLHRPDAITTHATSSAGAGAR